MCYCCSLYVISVSIMYVCSSDQERTVIPTVKSFMNQSINQQIKVNFKMVVILGRGNLCGQHGIVKNAYLTGIRIVMHKSVLSISSKGF